VEADLEGAAFYSGRYTGYSDEELMEVIDTEVFFPEHNRCTDTLHMSSHRAKGRERLIHSGKLLHFREIDRKVDLPRGTAQRLLNRVADRYNLKPALETENLVRYATSD